MKRLQASWVVGEGHRRRANDLSIALKMVYVNASKLSTHANALNIAK